VYDAPQLASGRSSSDAAHPASVRLLTWNLWWRFGHWRERLHAIEAVLEQAQPDICGLQEVWAVGDDNQAARLAGVLGLDWTWLRAPDSRSWQRRAGKAEAVVGNAEAVVGNAVLTRWPIVERVELGLPGTGAQPRTALLVVIQTPAGRMPFATTQFSSDPSASATRCRQVEAVIDLLVAHDQHELPVVLTGDLNAEPDSDEVRLLGGHKTAPVRSGFVLIDAWSYAAPDAIPWSWDRANPHVLETNEPNARIDYVFTGVPRHDGRGAVRFVTRIGADPVGGVWASDHAGLIVDIQAGSSRSAKADQGSEGSPLLDR
jgi:endonuclease/exonuclease/phosphatase family metal-dependent hydrolase